MTYNGQTIYIGRADQTLVWGIEFPSVILGPVSCVGHLKYAYLSVLWVPVEPSSDRLQQHLYAVTYRRYSLPDTWSHLCFLVKQEKIIPPGHLVSPLVSSETVDTHSSLAPGPMTINWEVSEVKFWKLYILNCMYMLYLLCTFNL